MTEETPELSRTKRRILWALVCLGLLLVLIFTPPLINVNRMQKRIAASMSASLGRPVHLDNASLHLFPVPGFTLQNLVVSEDPAFGSEPVIRANSVDVALRPSSLWRRQVELSSIKFEDPSLNLVRNAQGAWNIQTLLMHAASVHTAPTGQRKAGPAPRFPYIEATGARVNFKLGNEKKPFSLTEADFALWSPSTQQWRVRLEGQPARTDTNISDPGTVRIEGSLARASAMADVPVDLAASWDGAPLGEASKLLTGNDANWRGTLNMSATMVGTLSSAKLTSKIHLQELRRADFVPVQTLDLRTECSGTLDASAARLGDAVCTLHAPASAGETTPGLVVALADSVDMSPVSADGLRVDITDLSNAWLLDWARLFSQRIPAGERPGGTLAGSLALVPAPQGGAAVWRGKSWNGEIHGHVDGMLPWDTTADKSSLTHPVSIASSAAGLTLAPVSLGEPGRDAQENTPSLSLSGVVTRAGYTVNLAGTATEKQLAALRAKLPPLGDSMQEALPKLAESSKTSSATKPLKVDVTCSRSWGTAQVCAAAVAPPAKKPQRRRR